MEAALNAQINAEMQSSYIYLAMAACAEAGNHPGTAAWLKAQAQEEWAHAMKFYAHVNDRGGRVVLQTITQPQIEWPSLTAVFENVLQHEQKVTGMIHALYELAMAEKDYAAIPMLQWFITEQVEEEKTAGEVLQMLTVAGGSAHTLLFVDRELGKRGA
jgi:ferritin